MYIYLIPDTNDCKCKLILLKKSLKSFFISGKEKPVNLNVNI